jgi:hypothetical protein
VLAMNSALMITNEFFPQLFTSLQAKGTCSPARTPHQKLGRRNQGTCPQVGFSCAICRAITVNDLRRTGVRDLVRSGAPQSVAMQISGHRTTATFERYKIVTSTDTAAALERMAKYRSG